MNNDISWSGSDTLLLTAVERSYNTPPSIDAGLDQELSDSVSCVQAGYSTICQNCDLRLDLEGSGIDLDSDQIQYSWSNLSSELVSFEDTNDPESSISIVARPFESGSCIESDVELQLEGTDCTGATSTDTVLLTVSCCGY